MAGIYIHMPFCKKKCSYCDFYKTTIISAIPEYLECLAIEAQLRKSYLENEIIETIYLGGGTPSLLNSGQLAGIFENLKNLFVFADNCEITLEGNPDDLNAGYLKDLIAITPVNRLSIGIQSFNDEILHFLNRRHDASQALNCIDDAREAGFMNISVDLIYGIPGLTLEEWNRSLDIAFSKADHLSAYQLSIEPGTMLAKLEAKGSFSAVDEAESIAQFNALHTSSDNHGFIHYEISNLSKPGMISRHNSNYWLRKKYLGLGPSAHSYNGISRQWNVSDFRNYNSSLRHKNDFFETEFLNETERFNEYLMVSMRTIHGVDLEYLQENFNKNFIERYLNGAKQFIDTGKILVAGQKHRMTPEGWLISDYILKNLVSD